MSTPATNTPGTGDGRGTPPDPDLEPTRADIPSGDYGTATLPAGSWTEQSRDRSGSDPDPTVVVPTGDPASAPPAPSPPPAEDEDEDPRWESPRQYAPPGEVEPAIFSATEPELPRSRAAAHWWGVLVCLILAPVAWFLLVDGSNRIYWSLVADATAVNVAGLLGLGMGLVAMTAVVLVGRWSSVGVSIAGALGTLAGLTFLVFPARTLEVLADQQDTFERFGGFGANVYLYLVESGLRGYFVVGGVLLVLVGVVSHGARRKGRREERVRIAAGNRTPGPAAPR